MKNKLSTLPKLRERERDHQAALFAWARHPLTLKKYPALALLYAIPNGGSRHPAEAANLKRQGVLAGIPDICLPICPEDRLFSPWYAALYIEMKANKNKLTVNQKRVIEQLQRYGNKVVICYTWTEARDAIEEYLK